MKRIIVKCMLLINIINSQLILHKTSLNENVIDYDCLYYRVSTEKLAYQELSNIINEEIEYCIRSFNKIENNLKIFNKNLTFKELNELNISSYDLLLWSSPIDLVEEYEYYLNNMDKSLSNKIYNNCTKPWFGIQCEYSFELNEDLSIINIVENQFLNRLSSIESSNIDEIRLTCYIHLKCNRGNNNFCLDWREICNGQIDCLNNGIDEENCFEMEINECEENEYRCHNGLCIPEDFWENGLGDADCLDRSDEYSDVSYPNLCYRDPKFRCEEHTCRTNWYDFPCGDGQCVQKFDQCHNGRHHLLIYSIFNKENRNNKCSILMICLTKLLKEINGFKCEDLLKNKYFIFKFLKYCDEIFQFPLEPINLGHITFLYKNISLKPINDLLIIPDYICYDNQLCDCIKSTFYYQNLTCIHSSKLDLISRISGHRWIDMILLIDSYFRCCLTNKYLNFAEYENITSLYLCKNSTKLISKHRIIDENRDCCYGDDEDNEESCLINIKHRIKCLNENKCLSSLHTKDDCHLNDNQNEKDIPFEIFCDRLKEISYKNSNGFISTDESECDYWPCKTIYTKCDGFWSCLNGEDEENCYKTYCQYGKYDCISPLNYSLICLSNHQIGDGINDCLGGFDELDFCRRIYPPQINSKRFRCQNSDICLSFNQICDNILSCPLGDDERFCQNKSLNCHLSYLNENLTIIQNILCRLEQNEKNRLTYFSIESTPIYPLLNIQKNFNENIQLKSSNSKLIKRNSLEKKKSYSWPWLCNRGLKLYFRKENKSICMCPPSYYGDFCQYQNQRISLTLALISYERRNIYEIIILLINYENHSNDYQIESYHQFQYIPSQSCGIKLNRYLLYSTRPKNLQRNYTIYIDVLEKNQMKFYGRWIYSIPFLFLPVNRLSIFLSIPSFQSFKLTNCLINCQNGDCYKYINKDKYYCRCKSGWIGNICNKKLNCSYCSNDSLCYEIINNHPICLCPLMKFGNRCFLESPCPLNACLNNGQCIPSDIKLSLNDYSCNCLEEYYGFNCQLRKTKIDLEFEYINIPSYFLAFFLTITNETKPKLTIILQKLTLFQRQVTIYISIPFHILLIKSNLKYYLALVQHYQNKQIETIINPSRECFHIEYLFNSTILEKFRYDRLKYYHIPCQLNSQLNCFIDEYYLCLCTNDHHVNCLEFNSNKDNNLQCSSKDICLNNGKCFQDHPNCPSTIICVCQECFFGNQCQFYGKGLGLTLDEILGYEIKSNLNLSKQSFSVKLSSFITMIMFTIGLINCIFSILTLKNKICQEVGCGIYLLTSSVISLLIIILFTFKFWFLFFSFKHFFGQKFLLFTNCFLIEPLLKLFLYIDNWLNGCIAGERAFAVFKGISFQKKQSKQMAKKIILLVIFINLILFIPLLINLHLFYDKKEKRTWCGIFYSSLLNNYNLFLINIHFFAPFLLNIISSIFIIIGTTHQRVQTQNKAEFSKHFKTKFKQHKHLLLSPLMLILLSFPRLIISFTLDCRKSSQHFWLYLIGYFISFMPSISILIVFIFPSPIYKKEFKQVLTNIQLRISSFNFIKSLTKK